MKNIFLYSLLLPVLLSGGIGSTAFTLSAVGPGHLVSRQSSTSNNGEISCLINGKAVRFIPQGFIEIRLDQESKGEKDGIEILDGGVKTGFQFLFKKSEITKVGGQKRDRNCVINYRNGSGATYVGDGVIIKVISYDKRHLVGTFSGRMVDAYYTGSSDKNAQYIQVIDGKFDLHHSG